ncbi:LOW QUALITY PROTEIN: Ribonuclease E [Rhodotorula toruloides]|nr:LOW QUALITY PROTEIN: Ribonuclease E [Rhodotorula toruloides]
MLRTSWLHDAPSKSLCNPLNERSAAREAHRTPSEDNAAPQQEAPQPKRHELAQTDTLSLVPPSSNFHTVLRLFFHSDHCVFPLRADIDALLSGFEQRWASRMGEKSSMQVMKALWSEMGWKWVLLLGCPEGPLRRGWGQTVVRAFVEHLRPENPPLRQVAALFALYLLTQTQARGAEKLFVEVDPVLLQSSSFHLVPSVSSHAWPFVHVKRNAKLVHEKRERALLVLGAEEELERITRGDFDGGEASEARGTNRKRRDEEDVADAAARQEMRIGTRTAGSRIASSSCVYTEAKTASSARIASTAAVSFLSARPLTLAQPTTSLQASILERAKAMTRGRLRELEVKEADAPDLLELVGP